MQNPENNDFSVLNQLRDTMRKAVAALDACVERVADELRDRSRAYDTKLSSHLAYLTEHASRALGELRKLEAHDRAIMARMVPSERDELVRLYIKSLPEDRRAELLALLAQE